MYMYLILFLTCHFYSVVYCKYVLLHVLQLVGYIRKVGEKILSGMRRLYVKLASFLCVYAELYERAMFGLEYQINVILSEVRVIMNYWLVYKFPYVSVA